MGVHNLWELLAPVGRRVSVETLAGKRLAIDASIWMVQFMKAMRDEKGDMVRNAHLIGFFRRICKLLYLRTKPVFVFDGGTPALKRRTVIARRRQRENAQAKIRKTAEKMLLNQLKAINLKELAKDLENQRQQQKNAVENDTKGKKIVLDDGDGSNSMQGKYERSKVEVTKDHQEKLDEMLAAAIAAEEDGNLTYNASTSGAGILSEEENSEDEQMLLPAMHGNVDPAVLASLPPSMQLDLLVQMRERLMAENRQKYQKVKKAPEKFSELQIQAYLKTVAFRREIDQVQKTAAGRAVGGVQTSRIASEANREFIFSSSFTGDKQELASARGEENRQKQQHATQQHFSPTFVKSVGHVNPSGAATELNADEPRNPDENIEIYKDERGRLRIRNRHMGIPMTRDIQRNLALMKEKERTTRDPVSNTNEVDGWKNVSNIEDAEAPPDIDDESSKLNDQTGNSMLKNASSLEISFEHIGENKNSIDDDDFFTQLVTGEPVTLCSGDNPPKEHSSPCASDSDWEEMPVERKDSGSNVDATIITDSIVQDGNMSHESEVEWEETPSADHRDFAVGGAAKAGSKSCLEEEAALREAIRRSLLDIDDKKPKLISSEFEGPMISGDAHVLENQRGVINPITENATQQKETSGRVGGEVEDKERSSRMSTSDRPISLTPELSDSCVASRLEQLKHDANEEIKLNKEIPSPESKTPLDRGLIVSDDRNELSLVSKRSMGGTSHSLDQVLGELPATHMVDEKNNDLVVETSVFISDKEDDSEVELEPQTIVDDNKKDLEPEPPNRTSEMMEPSNPFVEPSRKRPSSDVVMGQTSIAESSYKKISSGNNHKTESITVVDDETVQSKFTEADYEKEMENLNEEFLSLGDEQRRLERNAESVSSEMFAECQELLQIFGLPYIIAPMEAEAQCAFMELSDLVDGVVTDDSDVFLFGGRSIYKNIFDDRKYVETYFMKDIEKELGLNREKLIHMALLLGSDYTEGISGIGVVNAIEVVNAFPEEDGLKKFREWVESPDPAILGKADRQSGFSLKKRGSMAGDAGGISADDMQDIKQIFMDKHRNVSKNWHIPSTFPSEAVVSAYASPQVDQSTEPFSWGKPDLLVLRKLCWEKFSWNGQKTDDLLLPVLKEYEKRETQLRMEAFYSFNERFAKIRSKRIEKAVKGITGDNLSNLTDENLQKASRKRKRKVRTHANEDNQSDKESTKVKGSEGIQDIPMEKATSKRMRKGGNKEKQNSKRISVGNKRGRGSGKGKHDLQFASSENSSDDGIGSNEGKSFHDEDPVQPQSVRRSARSRNPVNYIVDERAGDVDFCENAISHDKSDVLGGIEDEVADPSVDLKGKKRLEAKDIVFEGRLSGDYDQTAGESCANEAETGGGSMNHNGDPDMEIENREDYLTMGGGFCMEESETAEIKDAADETTCSVEGDDSLYGIDSMDRPNSEIGLGGSTSDLGRGLQRHGNAHKSDESLSEDSVLLRDVKTYTGTPTTGTLSAMPFLKRKKRR